MAAHDWLLLCAATGAFLAFFIGRACWPRAPLSAATAVVFAGAWISAGVGAVVFLAERA
jgi:hypothetical protein